MRAKTHARLGPESLYKLQQLIQANINSAQILQTAASRISDQIVAERFERLANQRMRIVDELQQYVEANQVPTASRDVFCEASRRWWRDIHAAVTTGDSYVVLIETKRAEDRMKQLYDEMIEESGGSGMSDVLRRHVAQLKNRKKAVSEP